MRITTMLNALIRVTRMQGSIYPKRLRQYQAFRDGIHKRWIRKEIDLEMAKGRAEFWEKQAKEQD